MSISVTPQIRVVALMGLLLVVLAGAYKFVLHKPASSTPIVIPQTHRPSPPAAAKAQAHGRTVSPSTTAAAAAAATSAAAQVHLHPVDPLLPSSLRWALAKHGIAVVTFWDPQAAVDEISVAEAKAGAADARVGFVLVNVLDNKVAGPLTALLPSGDMLPDPGVLVYRAPGKIVYRFDGFLDRDAVAQAAQDAKAGLDTAPADEATVP